MDEKRMDGETIVSKVFHISLSWFESTYFSSADMRKSKICSSKLADAQIRLVIFESLTVIRLLLS